MGNFNGGGNRNSGFRGNGGGRKSWGDDRPKVMHSAICSECGKTCEVPFKPTGEKPVYCSDCFSSRREEGDRRPKPDFGGRTSYVSTPRQPTSAVDGETKKLLSDMVGKLDRLVSVMEKMYGGEKPAMTPVKTEVKAVPATVAVKKVAEKKSTVKPVVKAKKKK
jgi:CxxC-x17-CxxC domain-containing protein